ncbi:MAG: putative 2OG-Fe(II) oxygenase [Rhodanobacteraceae bacterium]
MLRINPTFALAFAYDQHPAPQRMNDALRKLFLARESEGARHANPGPYTVRNRQLFESHFHLFSWPEPEIGELREFCLSRVIDLVAQLNRYDASTRARLRANTDAWFHVTRRGGFFGVHNHPLASWSGVYCVSSGEHDADQPESGTLTFIHPHTAGGMYVDRGSEFIGAPFGIGNLSLNLEPGQLVLFPSWILHTVLPFYGEGERITVAFNCAFRLEGDQPPAFTR